MAAKIAKEDRDVAGLASRYHCQKGFTMEYLIKTPQYRSYEEGGHFTIEVTYNGGATYSVATLKPDSIVEATDDDLAVIAANILDCDIDELGQHLHDLTFAELLEFQRQNDNDVASLRWEALEAE